jgi:sporulation protein YlmC with PRC-barrel domain
MKTSSKVPAIFALAAILSVPAVVAAQSTPPAARVLPPPSAAATIAPRPMVSVDSPYVTADQNVRASKVVGASVYNEQNQKIGSVDDMLIGSNDGVSGVVLSVGGFLGIDSKLVEVPYSQIQVNDDKLVMTGATKEDLTRLPEYKYKSRS